jgi:hypothetical protein
VLECCRGKDHPGCTTCKKHSVLGDICGKSHMPETCSLENWPRGIGWWSLRESSCYLCFRHPDSQPCPSQSLLACFFRGCMRMQHRLLHESLQKQEARAMLQLRHQNRLFSANVVLISMLNWLDCRKKEGG